MKSFVVVSAVGRDRPGLVNEISHEIRKNGGNIELQRSAKMADEFAIISLVSLDEGETKVDDFIDSLSSMKTADFFIYARKALAGSGYRHPESVPGEIIAVGADQMGLIDEVTLLLYQNDINIESMEYDVKHAPMTGAPLFQMHARIAVPKQLDVQTLKTKLRAMEASLNIDILFRFPLEAEPL